MNSPSMPSPSLPAPGSSGLRDGDLAAASFEDTDTDDDGTESGDSWLAEVEMEKAKNQLVKKGAISEYEAEKMATIAKNKEAQEKLRQEWMALGHDFEKSKPKPKPHAKKVKNGSLPQRRSKRNQGYEINILAYNLY
jgi:hypothetical protein